MQDRVLYTYALAKSLHENGRDILDVFVPFILELFDNEELNKEEIKRLLKKEFCLEIPGYTISTIITRAKRKGYLKQERGKLYLTDQGEKVQNHLNDRETERNENKFIKSLHNYLKKKNIQLSKREVALRLRAVINSNLCSLLTYLGEEPQLAECDNLSKKESREIINFFKEIEDSDNELFNILKNIIMGSIICAMVKKDQNILKSKLRPAKVFLDTNVVFSLLDYHHPDIALPVKELFNLLKSDGYKFYVFPFTIGEITRVLDNYKDNYKNYSSAVRVNSIYNRLKELGLTPSDMTEIIVNLEETLLKKDIKIYPCANEEIELNEESFIKLSGYKNTTNENSLKHDLSAISTIKKLRGKEIKKLEKAGTIFLTSDQRLTQYNFIENGHKENLTINEVILDQLLTNVLWFKKPNISNNLPLHAVMSLHADKLFVDNDIWERFQYVVKKMKIEDKITENDLSVMLYNDNIEEFLLDYEGEVDEIDEIFVETLISESKELYKEREEVFEHQREENKKLSDEKEQALDMLKEFTAKLYLNAAKRANIGTNIIFFCCIPLCLLIISILVWNRFSSFGGIITIFLSILAICISDGIIPKINPKEKINRYLNKYLIRKFKKAYFPNNNFEDVNKDSNRDFNRNFDKDSIKDSINEAAPSKQEK